MIPKLSKLPWAWVQSLLPLAIGIALTFTMTLAVPMLRGDKAQNAGIVSQRRELVALDFAHRNIVTLVLQIAYSSTSNSRTVELKDALASLEANIEEVLSDTNLIALLSDHGAQLQLEKEDLQQLQGSGLSSAQVARLEDLGSTLSEYSSQIMAQSDVAFAKSEEELGQMVRAIILASGALLTISLVTLGSMFRRSKDLFDQSSLLQKIVAELAEAQRVARLGTLYWDYQKDEVRWSDQLAEIFGISPGGSMSGSAFNALVSGDDASRLIETENMALALSARTNRAEVREINYRMQRPDGREVDLWARSELMATADGKPIYMLSTVRDVTEEAVWRRNLAESERSLALAQRISQLGRFRHLIRSHRVWWSDEMFDLLGYPRSEGPIALSEMVFEDDRPSVAIAMAHLFEPSKSVTECSTTLTFRMRHQNGDIRHFRCAAAMSYAPSGEPEELTGTLIDISQQVMQEEKLQTAVEDARRANAAKSDFLAVMSHELRTPLNGVLGMLGGLETTSLEVDQREQVQIARASANVLLEILNDILDMSKIEAGKLEIENAPFSPRDLVRSIHQLFAFRIAEKGLQIEIRIEDCVPDWLEADGPRIRQILSNLVSNAIKFTERGTINLTAQFKATANEADCHMLILSVADTGIGIALDKQKHVFERFNQLDLSYNRRFGGTGLGLSICQSLTFIMGGQISFNSIPSYGSTFSFSIPVIIAKTPSIQEITDQTATLVNRRVLVVDDNSTNLIVAQHMLRQLGQTVEVATDGIEAVNIVVRQSFDLIFMDLSMPNMDGYEALHQIRGMGGRFTMIPIIALTSHAGQREQSACEAAGFNGVLTKPLLIEKLKIILEQCAHSTATKNHNVVPLDPIQQSHFVLLRESISQELKIGLEKLANSGGADFVLPLLDASLSDISRYNVVIEKFAMNNSVDKSELKRTFHSIVGLARTVGCKTLAQFALGLEKAAATILPQAHDIQNMNEVLNTLANELTIAQDQLNHHVPEVDRLI